MGNDRIAVKVLCDGEEGQKEVTVNKYDTVGELKEAACKAWGVDEDDFKLFDWYKGSKHADLEPRLDDKCHKITLLEGQHIKLVKPEASKEDEEDVGAANISSMFNSDTSTAIVPAGKTNGVTTRSGREYGPSAKGTGLGSGGLFSRSGVEDTTFAASSRQPGLAGLGNLGNTCFMNSSLQCLAHTVPLMRCCLTGAYLADLNRTNPLGMKGELAEGFGTLMSLLWQGGVGHVSPRKFKERIGRFAPQFSGYAQHDAQEFLAFLLDGLHEDMNRIKDKPYIEERDSLGRPDSDVAAEAWSNYRARNDSVVVDHFQGLYKSTLDCPSCAYSSVKFDPFMYLSLPLPESRVRALRVCLVDMGGAGRPMQYVVEVPQSGTVKDALHALARLVHIPVAPPASSQPPAAAAAATATAPTGVNGVGDAAGADEVMEEAGGEGAQVDQILVMAKVTRGSGSHLDDVELYLDPKTRIGEIVPSEAAYKREFLVVYRFHSAQQGPGAEGVVPVVVHQRAKKGALPRAHFIAAPLLLFMPADEVPAEVVPEAVDEDQGVKQVNINTTKREYVVVGRPERALRASLAPVLSVFLTPAGLKAADEEAEAEANARARANAGSADGAGSADEEIADPGDTVVDAALTEAMGAGSGGEASAGVVAGSGLIAEDGAGAAAGNACGAEQGAVGTAEAAGGMAVDQVTAAAAGVVCGGAAGTTRAARGSEEGAGVATGGAGSRPGSPDSVTSRPTPPDSRQGGAEADDAEGPRAASPTSTRPLTDQQPTAMAVEGTEGASRPAEPAPDADMPAVPPALPNLDCAGPGTVARPGTPASCREPPTALSVGRMAAAAAAAGTGTGAGADTGPTVLPFNMWSKQEEAAAAAAVAAVCQGPAYRLLLADDRGNVDFYVRQLPMHGREHSDFIWHVAADWADNGGGRYDLEGMDEPGEHATAAAHAARLRGGRTPVSLTACVEAFLQPEQLSEEDSWFCPKCKQHVQADKKLDLWTLPEVLVVHLKRFSYTRYNRDKLETPVEFGMDLDLSPYIAHRNSSSSGNSNASAAAPPAAAPGTSSEPASADGVSTPPMASSTGGATSCPHTSPAPPHYTLFAVVNHFGSLGGGHYTAHARMPGGTGAPGEGWHNYDDSHVSPVDAADICTPAAYCLFYRRTSAAAADPPDLVQQLHAVHEARRSQGQAATQRLPGASDGGGDRASNMDQNQGGEGPRRGGLPGAGRASEGAMNENEGATGEGVRANNGLGRRGFGSFGGARTGRINTPDGPPSPSPMESVLHQGGSAGTSSAGGASGQGMPATALLQGAAAALASGAQASRLGSTGGYWGGGCWDAVPRAGGREGARAQAGAGSGDEGDADSVGAVSGGADGSEPDHTGLDEILEGADEIDTNNMVNDFPGEEMVMGSMRDSEGDYGRHGRMDDAQDALEDVANMMGDDAAAWGSDVAATPSMGAHDKHAPAFEVQPEGVQPPAPTSDSPAAQVAGEALFGGLSGAAGVPAVAGLRQDDGSGDGSRRLSCEAASGALAAFGAMAMDSGALGAGCEGGLSSSMEVDGPEPKQTTWASVAVGSKVARASEEVGAEAVQLARQHLANRQA